MGDARSHAPLSPSCPASRTLLPLLEAISDPVLVVDAERVVWLSAAARRLLGRIEPDDQLGHPMPGFLLGAGRARCRPGATREGEPEWGAGGRDVPLEAVCSAHDLRAIVLPVDDDDVRSLALLESMPDAIVVRDADHVICLANRNAEVLFGFPPGGMVGISTDELVVERLRPALARLREPVGAPWTGAGVELIGRRKDGTEFPMAITRSIVRAPGGPLTCIAARDITEAKALQAQQRSLEDRLQRAQRLESLGQLAGGIAHDFNNMLGVIMNYAKFVGRRLDDPLLNDDLQEVVKAAERAAALTRRLLVFAKREPVPAHPVDVGSLLHELGPMLRRSLGDRGAFELDVAEGLPACTADPAGIEQVVVNLVMNARDAIEHGGVVSIAATMRSVSLSDAPTAEDGPNPPLPPGDYVCIQVTDSGCGMQREILERAFEPFFTTKDDGERSGLGLAMAYGTVTRSRGHISLRSQPGRGTTVEVHLPVALADAPPAAVLVNERSRRGHGERVLLVEDDAAARTMTQRMLEEHGFAVLATGDARTALELVTATPVDLLLSDVRVPTMSGLELATCVVQAYPGLPVVLMSGQPPGSSDAHGAEQGAPRWPLLLKPFDESRLLAEVTRALDGTGGGRG